MNRAVVAAGALIAFTAGLVYCGAGACAGWFMPQQMLDADGQAYYQNAYTLIDLPSEDLVEALPELRGLVPAADQQPLPRILSEVGKSVEASYQKFTEIVANEQVTQEQWDPTGRPKPTIRLEFNYLILPRYEAGEVRIDEFRADVHGKPVEGPLAGNPSTEGSASMWALFYPGNQSGSKFRYLGRQRCGEHSAQVIGFAQRPGWSAIRGEVNLGGRSVVLLYQGVAWIDVGTYKILKMRLDLLKPRLDVKLETLTTEIRFGEVHIADAASTPLWVPLQVTLTTAWNGQLFRDQHLYSSYRLPGASTTIKSAPEGAGPPPKTN
jgi:hypothetical protein